MGQQAVRKDIWTLTPGQITNALRYLWITGMFYFTQSAVVKLTIIAFFLRIFPSQEVRRLLWATFIVTSLWGLTSMLLLTFQCRPTSFFWKGWDGLHEGSCFNASVASWANASGLVHFGKSLNPTWDFYDISVWSTMEIAVGIICVCPPTVRMLLVRLWPVLGSSMRSNGNHYQHYGSNSRSKSPGRPESSKFEADNDSSGVYLRESPTVQYNDNDETSLVHKNFRSSL
ncbi:hypothetical protein BKA56DRAFT_635516 [Ilyonectria sp. MPI-CAGE-AT-0026]|nr:hypothetical protein BKA56DRAFT_635516 [Ilyonectria sp. MPI-CAGE-AT-0026]